MAVISTIEGFEPRNNVEFLSKAQKLIPQLCHKKISVVVLDGKSTTGLKAGDYVRFDLGTHYVGHLSVRVSSKGSHPDAPAFIKIRMAEILKEFEENADEYNGWISPGWFQQEWIHIDQIPQTITLPRRYAMRYVQIEVLAASAKYSLNIDEVSFDAESAVQIDEKLIPVQTEDDVMKKIDIAGLRTLQNCMQEVFEDGPKRDRRLWLGDLRLQAKVNYLTFHNTDLVKRCLYLFAGSTFPDGRVGAAVFTDNKVEVDDTYLGDYALFFISVLYDYYQETKDMDTLKDLYATAGKQVEQVMQLVDERGVVRDADCFIDWCDGLDKQAAFQGVLIYCVRQMAELAGIMNDMEKEHRLKETLNRLLQGARICLYDESTGLFVSGPKRQISTASQVWMILADVFDRDRNRAILKRIREKGLPYKMTTPYMVHHYTEALCVCGKYEEAKKVIRNYWGKMVLLGADTFWESFNPDNLEESPYGGTIANSYCHAWSCTPSMLFRTYPLL